MNIHQQPDQELSSEVLQRHKIWTLHHLLPGVLHELNNPVSQVSSDLQVLMEYTSFLQEGAVLLEQWESHPEESWLQSRQDWLRQENVAVVIDDMQQLLQDISSGLQRLPMISQSLRMYLREPKDTAEELDLNDVLDNAMGLVHNRLKYHARVERESSPLEPRTGHTSHLCYAMVCILHNAAIAIGKKGSVSVSTAQQNNQSVIVIRDDGCGMNAATLDQALQPYVSCWSPAIPTAQGLGLSLAHQIITAHDGRLTLESQPEQGTSVTLTFP